MNRCVLRHLAVLLVLAAGQCAAQTGRENLHVALIVATDYRHYGLSQTDSDGAFRVSLDYEHDAGFFAGGFIANVEHAYEYRRRQPRELQVDLYGGYVWRNDAWTSSIALSRYLYPDSVPGYDYTQLIVAADFRERLFLTAAYSDDHLSWGSASYHYEIGAAWPLVWNLELGMNLGRFRAPDFVEGEFTHWDVGLSRVFGRVGLDLRYHDTSGTRRPARQSKRRTLDVERVLRYRASRAIACRAVARLVSQEICPVTREAIAREAR